jgi:PEP-CTERM motif
MTAADNATVVEITLNSSAIAALDAATGLIGLGGSITTLDDLANNEFIFAYSEIGNEITQLRLTLVAEPSTILLLGIGAISLLGYRKAKS